MRRFVVIGQRATVRGKVWLQNLPASSGRLDVLLRCVRAALLVSHGLRPDTLVYLVLLGDADAPRAVRLGGAAARFLRPDEQSLARTVLRALAQPVENPGFTELRHGVGVAAGGLLTVLEDLGPSTFYQLDEGGADLRGAPLDDHGPVFFVGDHLGFDEPTRAMLASAGATRLSVGPVSVHAEDAVTLVVNELDRRSADHNQPNIAV